VQTRLTRYALLYRDVRRVEVLSLIEAQVTQDGVGLRDSLFPSPVS